MVQCAYFGSGDILSIYLREITPRLIVETVDVHPGLLVDFDAQERPVALNISSASKLVPAYSCLAGTTAVPSVDDGKQPLQQLLTHTYDPHSQELTLWLGSGQQPAGARGGIRDVQTEHADIRIVKGEGGEWVGLRIRGAALEGQRPGEGLGEGQSVEGAQAARG
ncbi:hypothetical protein GPECTOR_35g889 [Gonium pectorale]|uniref:Uncharacterized protein n=1 Tax=Gonium pectorale TaxID=33097 RepID=A0A150GC70_GONPE|nr:hypothetical protein GPECTOR_35g889 [Gonium pectorale]|eukprot:KXZ47451.1 hypothetical protein GPECTOR_35g889 [Gonium pectorale]